MTHPTAQDEVVELCRDLIRIDTTNDGTGRGRGERAAAEYVAGKLSEVGLVPQVFESAADDYTDASSGHRRARRGYRACTADRDEECS